MNEEIKEFYDMAEKYGFCTPWCACDECRE